MENINNTELDNIATEEADKYCKSINHGHIMPNDWEIACDCFKLGYNKANIDISTYKKKIVELSDELDALNMKYLSQVSLWKSMYEKAINDKTNTKNCSDCLNFQEDLHIYYNVNAVGPGSIYYKDGMNIEEEIQKLVVKDFIKKCRILYDENTIWSDGLSTYSKFEDRFYNKLSYYGTKDDWYKSTHLHELEREYIKKYAPEAFKGARGFDNLTDEEITKKVMRLFGPGEFPFLYFSYDKPNSTTHEWKNNTILFHYFICR